MASLSKLQKTYKYVVTCILLEKTGSGLTLTSSCYWDSSMDGSCTVRWENKTMYCIVSAIFFGSRSIERIGWRISFFV